MAGTDRAYVEWDGWGYWGEMQRRDSEMGGGARYSVVIRKDDGQRVANGTVVVTSNDFRTPAGAWRAALGMLTTHAYRATEEG